ncbi:MAG: radical SAM protein [Candidatus Omnitrophica bacterium]|nr:radical SAM protein [Candidatus Omnitrophota bacterium]
MKKKEIVLVYPPISPGNKPFYSMPPLGVTFLATMLKPLGQDPAVIDAEHEGLDVNTVVQRVTAFAPHVVGISVMTPVYATALKIASGIKKASKGIIICLGGSHVSATVAETFKHSPDVDYLFLGESEKSFFDFCKNGYKASDSIDGIVYRGTAEPVIKPKKQFIECLDNLPYPDFGLIDKFKIGSYRIPYSNKAVFLPMMAGRGCPHKCLFCSVHTIHGKNLRMRSPANVLEEIKQLNEKFKAAYIVFKDSSLTADRLWLEQFCALLKESKLRINWRCNARPDEVGPHVLKMMKDAGCHLITYGLESGSDRILVEINKGNTVEDNKKAVFLTHKAGILAHCIYIIGSPSESIESINDTIRLAARVNSLFAQFCKGIAYPGNGFYDWGIKHNVLKDRFWYVNERPVFKESFVIDPNIGGGLSLDGIDQEAWIRRATLRYYLRPKYFFRFISTCFMNPYLLFNAVLVISSVVTWIKKKKIICG